MNDSECKTMAIPVMLEEARETGLISEDTDAALEHERLVASEQIENLRSLYRDRIISSEQLEASIRGIQKELQEKLEVLDISNV